MLSCRHAIYYAACTTTACSCTCKTYVSNAYATSPEGPGISSFCISTDIPKVCPDATTIISKPNAHFTWCFSRTITHSASHAIAVGYSPTCTRVSLLLAQGHALVHTSQHPGFGGGPKKLLRLRRAASIICPGSTGPLQGQGTCRTRTSPCRAPPTGLLSPS